MMRDVRYLVLWLMLASGAQAAVSHPLQHFFHDVHSYSAHFSQVVYDRHHQVLQRAKGRMWIERPNKFRWDYAKPYPQVLVGDGRAVYVYDVGLAQVTVRPMAQALGDTPALILSGRGRLRDHFHITHLGVRAGVYWVDLRPLQRGSGFQDVRLGFTGLYLTSLRLRDSLGQITEITLTEGRANAPIRPSRFQFVPPKGADVVHE